MTELCDIATTHGTDKGPRGWGYTKTYFEWLNASRQTVATVLEVGVWQGFSLRTWRDFFSNAQVYGIEIEPGWQCNEERIKTFCADGYNRDQMQPIMHEIGPVDFFVDDAVHRVPQQTDLLAFMWPFIRSGGVYAIEESIQSEIPSIQAAIAALPDVERSEFFPADGTYALTLLRKRG